MMNKERDKWDEAIRAKLFDHEVEPMPEDWEAIANRLPGLPKLLPSDHFGHPHGHLSSSPLLRK